MKPQAKKAENKPKETLKPAETKDKGNLIDDDIIGSTNNKSQP